jgi:hypothetical protein
VNNYLTLHEQVIAPQSIQNLSHIILCRGSLNHFDSVDEMVVLSSEISVDSIIPVPVEPMNVDIGTSIDNEKNTYFLRTRKNINFGRRSIDEYVTMALNVNGFYAQKNSSRLCVITHVHMNSASKIGNIVLSINRISTKDLSNDELRDILSTENIIKSCEVKV